MLYLVVETSLVLLVAAVVFFLLGAYYQKHFATAKTDEKDDVTGSWDLNAAKDDEKEWLRRRLAELEGQLAQVAKRAPEGPLSIEVDVESAVNPALAAMESRLETLFESKLSTLEARLAERPAPAAPAPAPMPAPRPAGPDAATLNALAAVERRLSQAMANHFATFAHAVPADGAERTVVTATVGDEHLAAVVDRFAQELASVESRLTATIIDQLSDQTAHRDPAVDIRNLTEELHRVESRLDAQRPEPSVLESELAPQLRDLSEAVERLERHAFAPSPPPIDYGPELRAMSEAIQRLETQSAATPVVPDFGPELTALNESIQRLELQSSAKPASPDFGPELRALNESIQRLELQTAMKPVAAEGTTDVRALADAFGRLERTVATLPDRPVHVAVNVDELNGRFERLEQTFAHHLQTAAAPDLAPMYGMLQSLHQRFDALEFRAVLPPPGNRPNDGSPLGPTLWTAPEPQPTAPTEPAPPSAAEIAAAETAALREAVAATTKELENIASTLSSIEAGTLARFDGIERQLVSAAKPAAPRPAVDDDRLERLERRLEEMSVRAEQTATAFQQIATAESMAQLGDEFRDNAATLERRTIALEVELARHREFLKKMSETPEPVTAPDPSADPAVIALESAKRDLEDRIESIHAALEHQLAQQAALAAEPDDTKALEEKLDDMERRLADHLSRAATQSRSDTAPMIEALRMDLAGLRMALLQSVASNRPPVGELQAIRTEIQRLRDTMNDFGKEEARSSARESELAARLRDLERSVTDRQSAFEAREREFEARERRLDDEYQERVVALERELEAMERKLEREEREDAKVSEFEIRAQRLEEREKRLEERESAMSERIAALEREMSAGAPEPELLLLRERLAAAEAALAKTSEERHEEELRRELERRMDERLSETARDSRELREELRDIGTMLREAPEPVPPPKEDSASKEVIARIDRLEDLLFETAAEARKLAAAKPEPVAAAVPVAAEITPKFDVALAAVTETLKAEISSLRRAVEEGEARLETELDRKMSELGSRWHEELTRRDAETSKDADRVKETLGERLEQLRSQLVLQLERQASEMKDAERELAERFELKLERSLDGVTDSLHRALEPRFETLQMAMRFQGCPAAVVPMPMGTGAESDGRMMARLEDRLRDIERSLHAAPPAGGASEDGRMALERERREIAEELREAERRSREKIRKLERELESARSAGEARNASLSDREEHMPRGRYGMSGGFMDPSRILEELEARLSETEERCEKLAKESASVEALEAELKSEREAREDLEDRLRELEHRDRDRQSALESAMERHRAEQGRQTLELRSDFRRELDDRLRDAEDRISRRVTPPPMPPAYPMAGFGMGGGDGMAMSAIHDMERRIRELMESMRHREAAVSAALEELRATNEPPRDFEDAIDEAVREATDSLERRIEALREDTQLSEPVTAALRAFRERLEAVEKGLDDVGDDETSPILQKLEDRIRELEAKERDQTTGLYADIDDMRRTLATERRTLEEKVEARFRELAGKAATPAGVSPEETQKLRKELEESNDRTQKQLGAMRDYVVKLDKAIRPLEERLGGFESQLAARVDDGTVKPEVLESLGERVTRLELAKPATAERVEAISQEVTAAIESLKTVFSNALTRLDGMEQKVNTATGHVDEAIARWQAQSEERIEDLVAHIDHLQEEMREEASERESEAALPTGIEPTELKRVEDEEREHFRELQERFERLEKSFGAKFEAVKHDLEADIHHSEERAHDDALSLSARTDERLEKMVGGLEKLVAEKENIIAELSDRVKALTEQVHQNPDDLTDIAGIGPKLKKKLKEEFGITTFKALATISSSDLERLAGMLLFPDRIFREDWIGQAREFHLRKYNELLPANEAEGEMRMRMAS